MSKARMISAILFFAIIIIVPVLLFVLPKQTFSENENRVLAEFPELSWESIQSGKFMQGIDAYLSDHFLLRDQWIGMKTDLELAAGKKEVNGVYILSDRLIGKMPEYDPAEVKKNTDAIVAFSQRFGKPVSMILAPTAVEINASMLDANAPKARQKQLIETVYAQLNNNKVATVDLFSPFQSASDQNIYYKSDHHWTSYGAYLAYNASAKSLGIQSVPLSSFNIEHASHDFLGTLYSKTMYDRMGKDTIDIYSYPEGTQVTEVIVNPGAAEKRYDSMYFREFLNKKDKYSVFLGSNEPVVTVKTDAENGKRLLVFKDSYAHSLVPFLTQHYSEITMVDMRYIRQTIDKTVDLSQYDQALFVYNAETYVSDTSIAKLALG